MFLDPAWRQQGLDALREMLDVDDHLKKQIIEFLFEEGYWDEKRTSWDAAVARYNACLNPNKEAFFKLSEIWAIAKRFRRYHVLYAMAEDMGFYRPREKPTEERRQELLERIATAEEKLLDEITGARAELARLDQPTAVHIEPAIRERRGAVWSQPDPGEGSTGVGVF